MTVDVAPPTWQTRRPLLPELALIAATVSYGATFKIVQNALEHVTPVGFILLRFSVGAIVLLPFAFRRGWRRPDAINMRARDFGIAVLVFGVAALSLLGGCMTLRDLCPGTCAYFDEEHATNPDFGK